MSSSQGGQERPRRTVFYDANGKKTFVPLENNPEVFTSLVRELGLSPSVGFYDVYSLDEPELLSLVPQPVHAHILITPAPMDHRVREADAAATPQVEYTGTGDNPVMWFKQTIGHSCGLVALLHCVANGSARGFVREGTPLAELLAKATPLGPEARAKLVYENQALEAAHMRAANEGDSAAPGADEASGFHFIAFVRGADGHLWELEGGWSGPVDRGPLGEGEHLLGERALGLGVRRFIGLSDGCVEFSIVALATRTEDE